MSLENGYLSDVAGFESFLKFYIYIPTRIRHLLSLLEISLKSFDKSKNMENFHLKTDIYIDKFRICTRDFIIHCYM